MRKTTARNEKSMMGVVGCALCGWEETLMPLKRDHTGMDEAKEEEEEQQMTLVEVMW